MKIATVFYAYGTSFLSYLFRLGLNTLLAQLTPLVNETDHECRFCLDTL